ncbi:MAG: hypothetical protein C4536_15110 [Actinobacteria bacterium]|jgi:hypothetical protein|nr:MAG: hypothetical protein C4536_15110 [Actinomycetota bacterium]
MTLMQRGKREALEAAAVTFLSEVITPEASSRLRDHGLQRVWVRAVQQEEAKAPAAARRTYRSPALLRHVIVVAMAVLMVMLVSTTGAYAFSYNAQPDSPLYGTKIFFERARITLTPSSTEDIRLEMRYSERRMEELQKMAASGNQEGADRWSREYSRNIEGAGILFDTTSPRETEELSAHFQEMLYRQASTMQVMCQGQPPGLCESIDSAYRVCDQEMMHMRQRRGQQEPESPQQEPGGQQHNGNCPPGDEPPSQETTTPGERTYDSPAAGDPDPMPSGDAPSAPGAPQMDSPVSEKDTEQQEAEHQSSGMQHGHLP